LRIHKPKSPWLLPDNLLISKPTDLKSLRNSPRNGYLWTGTNYYQMTESIATAGQPTQDQFLEIKETGVKVVINLAMPDGANALADEGSIVSRLGMVYIHIPVPWEAPELHHLNFLWVL